MDQDFISSAASREAHRKAKIIKRYGNRKLYDTEQSSYVVLNDIAKMIRNEEEVQIIDNETKSDITSATLTQIIFGAEKKSHCSAPLDILKSIIRKGDGSFSNFLAEMGLFKARMGDKTILDDPNGQKNNNTNNHNINSSSDFQHKTIQERVARAALSPDPLDNESPILPISKNNLKK